MVSAASKRTWFHFQLSLGENEAAIFCKFMIEGETLTLAPFSFYCNFNDVLFDEMKGAYSLQSLYTLELERGQEHR